MADIIIMAVLAVAAFFIIRSQLRRMRSGGCSGGCAECGGCEYRAEEFKENNHKKQ